MNLPLPGVHAALFPSLSKTGPGSGLGAMLAVSALGLVLGMRHSTDADHVVALSTIVSQQRSVVRATMIGGLWGVGHTITIVAVGAVMILLHVSIPTRLGLAFEFCVGVMLVVLGLLNLTGRLSSANRGLPPVHIHAGHSEHRARTGRVGNFQSNLRQFGIVHALRPILIGLVHGLAGSAAVALLVMDTIPDPRWAVAYLVVFGAGTVLGMMLMTTAIAIPLAYGSQRFSRWNQRLVHASGVGSVCFGSLLIYQLGFVQGLFTRTPHWIPR